MQKTNIEWCVNPDGTQGYTSNPIKGYCPNDCPYCYAHRFYERFNLNKTIRLELEPETKDWKKLKEPSRIFVGSTIDMYHPDIHNVWISDIIIESINYPQHTFITLTKYPENLYKYSFPKNWWLGTTIDYKNINRYYNLIDTFSENKLFISFEPLLSSMVTINLSAIDWIIIGGKFPGPLHKKEWIDDLVSRADKLNIPIFIKKNANYLIERKEFPI